MVESGRGVPGWSQERETYICTSGVPVTIHKNKFRISAKLETLR